MMLLTILPLALAHTPGLSYAVITDDALVLTFSREELGALLGLEPAELVLPENRDEVAGKVLAGARLETPAGSCVFAQTSIAFVENDGVALRTPMDCPASAERSYEAEILSLLEPGHRQYVEVNGQPEAVLDRDNPRVQVSVQPSKTAVFGRFWVLGLEHILTGYDHLAFLGGLLLGARSLRSMLLVITSFTLAHSLTLSAAALGWIELPASIVEPAIAASIVWVGLENLRGAGERRHLLTFALGLIHGFGFAGLLRELGLPRDSLVLALVSFNVGIEVGQAALAAASLPVLLWARRYPGFDRVAVPVGSVLVALAGLFWLIQRLLG